MGSGEPSGGAPGAPSVPTTPEAPERFSTTICWPRDSESLAARSLPTTSTLPPGGNGDTRRIAFDGYWAAAGSESRPRARSARRRFFIGKLGRRDWTRTNDPHHVKVVL